MHKQGGLGTSEAGHMQAPHVVSKDIYRKVISAAQIQPICTSIADLCTQVQRWY